MPKYKPMPTDALIFGRRASEYGGTLDTSFYPSLRAVLDFQKRRIQDRLNSYGAQFNKMPKVYLDYMADEDINACAFEACGRAFIGINGGTIGFLLLIFRRMMVDPTVWPHIGDVSRVHISMAPLSGDPQNLFAHYSDAKYWVPILDKTRNDLSVLLVELAILFLVDHEYTHLFKGHHLLSENFSGRPFMLERAKTKAQGIDRLTLHAMEFQADDIAAHNGLMTIFETINNPRLMHSIARPFHKDLLYYWLFASQMMFRLFGTHDLDLNNLFADDHPHPRVRQFLIIFKTMNFLEQHYPSLYKTSAALNNQVAMDVERYYCVATGTQMDTATIWAMKTDARALRYIQSVWNRVFEIEPELIRLSGNRQMASDGQ